MILPGISGAFILVLLGAYETALETIELVRSFRMLGFESSAFGLGAITGLKLFAPLGRKTLSQLSESFACDDVWVYVWFLYKVWPWKQFINVENRDQIAVLPNIEHNNSELWISLLFMLIGSFESTHFTT